MHDAIRQKIGHLLFGRYDIWVQLANGRVNSYHFGPESYKVPPVTDPKLFFAGENNFIADDMEVLVSGGTAGKLVETG